MDMASTLPPMRAKFTIQIGPPGALPNIEALVQALTNKAVKPVTVS